MESFLYVRDTGFSLTRALTVFCYCFLILLSLDRLVILMLCITTSALRLIMPSKFWGGEQRELFLFFSL